MILVHDLYYGAWKIFFLYTSVAACFQLPVSVEGYIHLLEQSLCVHTAIWESFKKSVSLIFQNLICSECGDEFTLQSQLSIHMEEHRQELAGSRIHSCKSCKKEFETSSQLKEHMKTHYKIRWQSWDCNKMRWFLFGFFFLWW